MPPAQPSQPSRPQPLKVDTLMKRGIAIAFTTPMLNGSRIRVDRDEVELIVPNPGGGRGSYVMPVQMVTDYCSVTVHDQLLLDRLIALDVVSPLTLKKVHREIALSGAAGREAAKAARAARNEEDALLQFANFLLIDKLIGQAGISAIDYRRLTQLDAGQSRTELRSKLKSLTPLTGLSVDKLFATAEEIAYHVMHLGFHSADLPGRHATTLEDVRELAHSLKSWLSVECPTVRERGMTVLRVLDWTITNAEEAIADCRRLLADLLALIVAWSADKSGIKGRFALCDWVLDGWPENCALWSEVANDVRPAQRAVFERIDRSLPPQIDGRTLAGRPSVEERSPRGRWVKINEDWKTGLLLDDQQRLSEAVKASCA